MLRVKITSYQQAKEYLESFIKPTVFRKIELAEAEEHDPLERMRVFLKLLDNPQDKFKSIQVSGTSGKGSTAYYISHILATAGYTVGFSTSPHLMKINERIQINNIPISDDDFVKLLASMIRIIEAMKTMKVGEPSYFEITMAMSFLYFAQKKVDIAVVEVGIEGKYDASNTLSPIAAVLTNIDLDHTDILGETVEEIASEAISIVHSSRFTVHSKEKKQIVVTGVKQSSVLKVIEQRCKETGAELFLLNRDFRVKLKNETTEGSIFDFYSQCHSGGRRPIESGDTEILSLRFLRASARSRMTNLTLSMLGSYQIENAGIAIETVLKLQDRGFKISEQDIRKALSTAFFPGRFEVVHSSQFTVHSKKRKKSGERITNNCELILDGAHNPIKMHSFITSLNKLYPHHKKIFVVAFKGNKDTKGMLTEIVGAADVIIATQFDAGSIGYVSTGAADVLSIKDEISKIVKSSPPKADPPRVEKVKSYTEKDPKKALEKGMEILRQVQDDNGSIIVVTGSLYLVGELRGYLKS